MTISDMLMFVHMHVSRVYVALCMHFGCLNFVLTGCILMQCEQSNTSIKSNRGNNGAMMTIFVELIEFGHWNFAGIILAGQLDFLVCSHGRCRELNAPHNLSLHFNRSLSIVSLLPMRPTGEKGTYLRVVAPCCSWPVISLLPKPTALF